MKKHDVFNVTCSATGLAHDATEVSNPELAVEVWKIPTRESIFRGVSRAVSYVAPSLSCFRRDYARVAICASSRSMFVVSPMPDGPVSSPFLTFESVHSRQPPNNTETMKTAAVVTAALIGSASAFAPQQAGRPTTSLAEKKSIAARIFDMDLFAPVADQNDYGARAKKNLKQGKIGSNSYVPSGLSASEYAAIRDKEAAKKAANYQKNVAKAGKFLDYTKFYMDRGTDTSQSWFKSVTRGHTMAKTKYDWSGKSDTSSKSKLDNQV